MKVSYTYRNLEHLPSILFGFKIHLSATYQNYQSILDIAIPYLDKHDIAYKYIENKEDIFKVFSLSETAAEVGKLVTIYPSPADLIATLDDLYRLLPKNEDGVYILSDRPYKDSKLLFYRFGLFRDSKSVYKNGIPTLTSLDGEEWQDYPKTYFDLPSWIDDIQPPHKTTESYLGQTYTVTSILHQSGGGNVYVGNDNKYMTPVTFKEVRPHILSFYDVEKKELREKEYSLSCYLNENNVHSVITPIERVDEWINTYYIYHYIQGESLTDFTKKYGINSYSRDHKTKNLRLFQKFLKLVHMLTQTIIYLHDHQLILNDIHPDNFVVDKDRNIHFIDLENSYIYGEKPFVGIESKISLKSWNFLDGKESDFHKLGNMLLFLFGRLHITEDSRDDIELLNELLISYGIDSNISDFICYLTSEKVCKERVEELLHSLYANPINVEEAIPKSAIKHSHKNSFIQRVKSSCNEFKKYQQYLGEVGFLSSESQDNILRLMNSERNLGINGLAGIISLLQYHGFTSLAEEGIDILLEQLVETDEGLMIPMEGGFYSPYICNGLSGVIQTLYYVNKEKYKKLILDLRKSLLVEFAQYEDYNKGMLGIADTLLLTTEFRDNKSTHQCIKSLLINCQIYYNHRHLPQEELEDVRRHYYDVYSF